MLRKLLKYEVKATAMVFVCMYLAIIGLSIFNKLFNTFNFQRGKVLTGCIVVALFVALGVTTVIMAVQRFNKNLLGDEGYLMFTLPVDSKKIIISKLLVTLMWTVISGLVAIISFIILFSAYMDWYSIKEVISQIQVLWHSFNEEITEQIHMNAGVFISCIAIGGAASYIEFILIIYGSLTVAQLPVFSKHRGLSAFGTFFVLNILVNNVLTAIFARCINLSETSAQAIILSGITVVIIICIGLFFGINTILSKHLNLE